MMKFPNFSLPKMSFPHASAPIDVQALNRTITDALTAAGLDTQTGPMKAVAETLQRALAGAGVASAGDSTIRDSQVIDIQAREIDATGAPDATAPSRGRTLGGIHKGPAGSRSYQLYVPAAAAGSVLPLVVMLHGCTQSPDDFSVGTGMNALADRHGFVVAYPAQSPNANGSKCWNWFRAQDQSRDGGEPALIAGIVRDVIAAHPIDPTRVFVAGLSAGGAMAVILGQTHPELFAAIGVHSGLPFGAAHDMPSAFQAMGADPRGGAAHPQGRFVPTIVFHGDRDTTVNAGNGAQVVAHALAGARGSAPADAPLSASVEKGASAGGSRYTRTVYSDPAGTPKVEDWVVHGAGHAWSGGNPAGSYTAPAGPDASEAMLQFFLAQRPTPAA